VIHVRHKAPDGSLLVRDNLILAFFAQGAFGEVAVGFKKAIERWLQQIPSDELAFGLSGASASELKPLTPTSVSRNLSKLKGEAPAKGEMTTFTMQGPEEDNPAYRVEVLIHHSPTRTSTGTLVSSFIEFRFPSDYLKDRGVESLVKLATEIADDVQYNSGYLSPGVCWSYESDLHLARKVIGPLGLRHPGLDISFNASSSYDIDKQTRGPYWVTFLGTELLDQLGGVAELRSLEPPVKVIQLSRSVAIRASAEPHVGDTNRSDKPAELRAVAEVLEPITFFGDKAIETYLYGDNADTFQRWDRRLLD
jgi:TseV toxin immunity protein TsiV